MDGWMDGRYQAHYLPALLSYTVDINDHKMKTYIHKIFLGCQDQRGYKLLYQIHKIYVYRGKHMGVQKMIVVCKMGVLALLEFPSEIFGNGGAEILMP